MGPAAETLRIPARSADAAVMDPRGIVGNRIGRPVPAGIGRGKRRPVACRDGRAPMQLEPAASARLAPGLRQQPQSHEPRGPAVSPVE